MELAGRAASSLLSTTLGKEPSKSERNAFVMGGLVGSCGLALLAISRTLLNKERKERNLSHLHHLDARMSRRTSTQLQPPVKGFRRPSVDSLDDGRNRIFQVVLTGGPCAGKSSAMEFLADRLRAQAFDVYVVPEVPTLLLNGGCVYPGLDGGDTLITFEASLIELQLQMEQTFYNIAKSTGRPSIILYDRGLLDVAAYLPQSLWHSVLNYNQWVRDGMLGVLERYDLILHLVTAADGAEKHFRHAGAESSAEAIEQARKLDRKIMNSYRGHPHHHIVDNATDFAGKLDRVFKLLDDMVRRNSIDLDMIDQSL